MQLNRLRISSDIGKSS